MKYVTVLAGIIMLLSGGYMIRDASHTIIAGKNLEQDTILEELPEPTRSSVSM